MERFRERERERERSTRNTQYEIYKRFPISPKPGKP
jgi:hypothetical protein